ncbi:hypothetical protein M9H77_31084 [Catharanthus roseus]|uniref:Uncharacterized protein n=1 Tax=Catharanthus roseus TaxID=4058 RepID=A0ACC0A1Q8_CATRO|nr:hypothetical protein M9H77_31084 [Catharanthus roseus]
MRRVHMQTGSSMPTDEQLMFEATCGSNKGHVCGFGSQSTAITIERGGGSSSLPSVPSVSSSATHNTCIDREKRLWGYIVVGTGHVRRFHDLVHLLVWCTAGFDNPDVPEPPTCPPSSSSPPLSM